MLYKNQTYPQLQEITAYYGFQWKSRKFPMACFLLGMQGTQPNSSNLKKQHHLG